MIERPDYGDLDWLQSGTLADVRSNKRVEYAIVGPKDGNPYFDLDGGPRLDLAELRQCIHVPYTIERPEGGFRQLSSFTPGQIEALYPFALVLACLDGNAFVNRENPEHDLVRQYIPEVFAILDMNGCVELSADGAKFRSDR